MAASAITKNSENIKQTISDELLNGFCQNMCHMYLSLCSECEGTKQVRHSIPRNYCLSLCINIQYLSSEILSQTEIFFIKFCEKYLLFAWRKGSYMEPGYVGTKIPADCCSCGLANCIRAQTHLAALKQTGNKT